MLSDKARLAIADIVDYAKLALGFVEELAQTDFLEDRKTHLAVMRCLEVISEASRRIPADVKDKIPHINWRAIASAGNSYRHEYDRMDHDVVWDTVKVHVSALLAEMQQILKYES